MAEPLQHVTSDKSSDLVRRLAREYIAPYKKRVWLAIGCMMVVAATTAGNAWMVKPMMDKIFVERQQDMLVIIPLVILALTLIKGAASYGESLLMKTTGQRMATDLQMALYRHLLHADVAMFSNTSSGNLISRFTNDIHLVRRNLTQALVGMAKESLTLLFLVGVMVYQSWELAILGGLVFPLGIWPIMKLGRRMRKVSRRTQEELGEYTKHLDDTFQNVRMVKACANEEYESTRARDVVDRTLALYIKAAKIESAASPILEALAGIAIAVVVWYGGRQVMEGTTTPGAFFSFVAAFLMAYKPLKTLSGLNTSIQEGLASVKRIFAVLDMIPAVKDAPDAMPLRAQQAELRFDKVKFSYGSERQALQGLSFTVQPGQRVALVGTSGAGKSTIMSLMLRFYDPSEGGISINGQDLRGLTLDSLRRHIALVNQEATLFDDTIRANILYGRTEATDTELVQAAKDAAAHEFINDQPQGYATLVGQHGVKLSGGQRQRIAIARAMLKDAPILLLDEATSALDTVSEKQVQVALDRLMKGRTTLVIAHRLSTILHADVIHVMEGGRIVESGTHKELLERRGAYHKLYQHQFAGQEGH
jgi:ATP-binding cassette, subfamily B, bacterial MsbA